MTRDCLDYLQDIIDAMADAQSFVQGITYEDFVKDKRTINSVLRSLEVVGEATKNVPDDVRQRFPLIPWRSLAGMRDKLIHQYFGVNLRAVWDTVQDDLPSIRPAVEAVREALLREKTGGKR